MNDDRLVQMALLWNRGLDTREIASRVYGHPKYENAVYGVIDSIKRIAQRIRRTATPFSDDRGQERRADPR